jgi:hypothetical protein
MKAIPSAKGLPPTDGLSAVRNPLLRADQAAFGLFTVTILSRILPRSIENLAEIALRDLNVIIVLQIEPKLGRCAECLGEPKRRIGGDAGLFAGDPLDPRARQAAGPGKSAGHTRHEAGMTGKGALVPCPLKILARGGSDFVPVSF